MATTERPTVLLTNDDGITSPGLTALQSALSTVADGTVGAPTEDHSHAGRAVAWELPVSDHQLGYAVDGTPADCVIVGIDALDVDPDLVVSGVNKGANISEYVLGRSGTVSAAVEAAFFDVPAIAASLYVPPDVGNPDGITLDESAYADAAAAVRYLVAKTTTQDPFDSADYLNVNVPYTDTTVTEMRITRPSDRHEMGARQNGDVATLVDQVWELIAAGELDEPEGTDRRAMLDGAISVSPLRAPHASDPNETLASVVEGFAGPRPEE